MNIKKFKKACDACGKTYDDVANLLGCKKTSLYRKLELPDNMRADEIIKLTKLLNLNNEDFMEIFYPNLHLKAPEKTDKPQDGDKPDLLSDPGFLPWPQGGPGPAAPAAAVPCPEPESETGDACPDDADGRERMYRTKKTYAHDNNIRVTEVLAATEKEFYDFKDMMAISGRQSETCRRMIRKIKAVSDVFGISGVVHRVDYVKYLQTQLDNGTHLEPDN